MGFREINAVKRVQLYLEECGLYTSGIDGVWGGGCRDALQLLLRDHTSYNNKPAIAGLIPAATMAPQVVTQLQTILKSEGLYLGAVDGIWGTGSESGVASLVSAYRARRSMPQLNNCWGSKVPRAFMQAIIDWVTERNHPAAAVDWLMACMNFESGGTFDPKKRNNGGSNYYGLIQFGTAAAKDLGYALDQVIAMDQLTQLKLVFAYFDMWAKRGKRYTQLEDFYLTILYPAAVGMKADEVLWKKQLADGTLNKNYTQNNGFDKDKDGQITIGEICTTIYASYFTGMLTKNRGNW